jgi:hypothetical protein
VGNIADVNPVVNQSVSLSTYSIPVKSRSPKSGTISSFQHHFKFSLLLVHQFWWAIMVEFIWGGFSNDMQLCPILWAFELTRPFH